MLTLHTVCCTFTEKKKKTFKLNQRVIRLGGMLMRTAKNVNEHAHFSTKQIFGNDKLRSEINGLQKQ